MAVTIAQCLARASELTHSDSARFDTELLLANVLKRERSYLFTWPDKELNAVEQQLFFSMFARRVQGEPVAFILGSQSFWSLDLDVAPSTLIPRPETELLVELALDRAHEESRILDLGTGTGAIALALASELRSAELVGVDHNQEAVALAQRNLQKNRISNATFFQSNWFADVEGYFDLIVSNPPYIEENDPHLQQGDVRFEPRSALVSGDDGLDDIREIVQRSKRFLHDEGYLLIEHGYNQAKAVQYLFACAGFDNIETVKDLQQNDRVTLGCLHV